MTSKRLQVLVNRAFYFTLAITAVAVECNTAHFEF